MKRLLWGGLLLLALGLTTTHLALARNDTPPPDGGGSNSAKALSGYAWSSNIGWISFSNASGLDGPTYGVTLLPAGSGGSEAADARPAPWLINSALAQTVSYRYLSGYAWNSAIGWIKFDQNLAGPASGNDHYGARLDISGSGQAPISGWARACIVFQSGCSGALKADSELGGWDGWIKFSGSAPGYGLVADSASNPTHFLGGGTNYAWGGNVIGWVSFCDAAYPASTYCVLFGGFTVGCQIIQEAADGTTFVPTTGGAVTWRATASGGTKPYNYTWSPITPGNSADPHYIFAPGSSGDDNAIGSSSGTWDVNKPTVGEVSSFPLSARVVVTDANNLTDGCTASTNIISTAEPDPTGGDSQSDLSAPSPDTIRITSQPLASPAVSSETQIYNQSASGSGGVNVALTNIVSTVSPGISLMGNPQVLCRMRDTAVTANTPASEFNACNATPAVFLADGNVGRKLHINIKVTSSINDLNKYSPYLITIGSSTCASNCGNLKRSFLFDYAVGTINPR